MKSKAPKFSKQNLNNLYRAIRIVWQSARGLTITSTVLQVLQGVLPLVSLYMIKLIIDEVTQSLSTGAAEELWNKLLFYITLAAGVGILLRLVTSLSEVVQEYQGIIVTDHVTDIIHKKSLQVDLQYYENPAYFDTLHLAQHEAPVRPNQVVNSLTQLVQNSITMVALLGLLFYIHWSVSFILLIAVLPALAVKIIYSRRMFVWKKEVTARERRAFYYSWLMSAYQTAKEIRLLNLGPLFGGRYRELRRKIRQDRLKLSRSRVSMEFGTHIFSLIIQFGCLAFVAWRTIHGKLSLGDMVMFYQAFQRGQNALKSLLRGVADLFESSLFLNHFFDFLAIKPRVQDPPEPVNFPRPIRKGIVVENLSFSYPGSSKTVIRDINFTLKPGEHVALVGENGAGKTTLIKLLCRLYDPTQGRILLDDRDLADYKVRDVQDNFGVVFQDYMKYYLSARENIWFGDIRQRNSKDRIYSAAREAGADVFINKLPDRFDTLLGKWFEQGEELSIGQWQKIALARAFLRNAPIVVLDEPTSALDARAEYRIYENFKQLSAERMAIFISHRLATARIAHRILVLENGRLVEDGTHKELLAQNGTYAHLFELQSRNYR